MKRRKRAGVLDEKGAFGGENPYHVFRRDIFLYSDAMNFDMFPYHVFDRLL